MIDWISVEDELPEYELRVLMRYERYDGHYHVFGYRIKTDRQGEHWVSDAGVSYTNNITHWFEL